MNAICATTTANSPMLLKYDEMNILALGKNLKIRKIMNVTKEHEEFYIC